MQNNIALENYKALYRALMEFGILKNEETPINLLHSCADDISILLNVADEDARGIHHAK